MSVNKVPTSPILPNSVDGDGSLFVKGLKSALHKISATINQLIEEGVGTKGDAATITIGTTTTGSPGSSASVSNSGTSSAAVFNFVIPRGDKGETGKNGVMDVRIQSTEPSNPVTGTVWVKT